MHGRRPPRARKASLATLGLLLACALGFLAPATGAAQRAATRSALPIPAWRDFRHRESIRTGYDEPSGYGSVELRPMTVLESPELALTAMFVFKGRVLQAPPARVSLGMVSRSDAPRFATAASRDLAFTLDGGRQLRLGELFRVADSAGGRVVETMALRVDTPRFLQLVNARSARGRIGATEFALRQDQLEALRDFASRMSPAAYRRTLAEAASPGRRRSVGEKAWYDVDEVDRPAELAVAPVMPPFPALPDSMRTERQVQFEYVVDTTGRVELATLRGRFPDRDAPFIEALRSVAPRWVFRPAVRGGVAVRQRVRQWVVFHPPGGCCG